jgi:hypothetical protein
MGFKLFAPVLLAVLSVVPTFAQNEQVTIQQVTITTPSGVIKGKVVGTGDSLVFVDDTNPSSSFKLRRGDVTEYRTEDGAIIVMTRPNSDQAGTTSNVRIVVSDPGSSTTITKWLAMPVERSRTVTTYSTDVRHEHKGKGSCQGKLIADDTGLRYESVTDATHSRSWNYSDVRSFEKEKEYSLLKVTSMSGDTEKYNTINGKTAGAVYDIVAQKIVDARTAR